MATTLVLNSDGWTITAFYGGENRGRCYDVYIPGKDVKTFTEEEFMTFLHSLPHEL